MWDGFLLGKRYLIHDRDPLFTEAVRGLLRDSGVKPLRLPANSPNLNAYSDLVAFSSTTAVPRRLSPAMDIRELMVCVARENPMWGYTRLRGALRNLKHRH